MNSDKRSTSQGGRSHRQQGVSSASHSQHAADNKTSSSGPAKSGRAVFDSRGNASWEWKTEEDGKYSREVSTQRLKKLEAAELSLEESTRIKKLSLDRKPLDFDPYDRGAVANRGSASGAAAANAAQNQANSKRKPIKDLKRYDEWLKMKRRIESESADDE
jgi:hypothetical protein